MNDEDEDIFAKYAIERQKQALRYKFQRALNRRLGKVPVIVSVLFRVALNSLFVFGIIFVILHFIIKYW